MLQDKDVIVITENSSIPNTINWIKKLTIQASHHPEIKQIAEEARQSDNVLKFVFDYSYDKILYVPNEGKKQQLRTVWNFLRTRKGNCAIYVELIGAVLLNLGIPFKFRVVNYITEDPKTGAQIIPKEMMHVYIVTKDGTVLDPVIGQRQDGTDTWTNRPRNGQFNVELPYYKKIDYPMARLEILQGNLGANPNFKYVVTNRSKMSRYGMLNGSVGCGCQSQGTLGLFKKLVDKFVRSTPAYQTISEQVSTETAERLATPISEQIQDNLTKVANTLATGVKIASAGQINLPKIPTIEQQRTSDNEMAQLLFDDLNNQQPKATKAGMGDVGTALLIAAGLGTLFFATGKKGKGKGGKRK
jgi:hypothetical protein